MTELTLNFDKKAADALADLMIQCNVKSRAELISKALRILKIVAHVNQTDGEIIARKGEKETKIIAF